MFKSLVALSLIVAAGGLVSAAAITDERRVFFRLAYWYGQSAVQADPAEAQQAKEADRNGDGKVDLFDLLDFTGAWLAAQAEAAAATPERDHGQTNGTDPRD